VIKTCSKCKQSKFDWCYYRKGNGYQTWCKDCKRGDYFTKKARYSKLDRRRYLKKKYGISEEVFNWMLKKQYNACAVCDKEAKLVIDHDHATGVIRGLLCTKCNTALGLLGDDKESLFKMILYLGAADEKIQNRTIREVTGQVR